MLRDRKFIIAISVAIFLIVLIGVFRPSEIDWTPSFSSEDKIPYGTFVLYNSLPDIFKSPEISINTKSPYSLLHKKDFSNTSLFFIQNDFNPTVRERRAILSFAAAGNSVFIATGEIHKGFAAKLKLVQKRRLFPEIMQQVNVADTSAHAEANFTNPRLHSDSAYVFKKDFYSAFYSINEDSILGLRDTIAYDTVEETTVLGVDASNRPTFIRVKYGEGYIFIHNNPYAFSNYYMLKPRGGEYVAKCLSYLPAHNTIIWDEFYKKGESSTKTSLSFILSRESLRWAYFTSVVFLLLFVLFNIKRRQRAIPIIEPYKNASLEFTETIGSLYFNQSNHKNIAKKKITYFLEFIRNRYNIDTTVPDEELARRLAYKSGVSLDGVEHLLTLFNGIAKKNYTTSTELIDLNHAIEYFKHNCQ
jgi:hypothetical protein